MLDQICWVSVLDTWRIKGAPVHGAEFWSSKEKWNGGVAPVTACNKLMRLKIYPDKKMSATTVMSLNYSWLA